EVRPDWAPVHARIRDEATTDWDDAVAVQRLEKAGARVVRGHARLAGTGVVEVAGQRFEAARGVVLNTGTSPAVPPIAGLADTPFWTNRDILRAAELPASLVVIGGGAIGAELAQAVARFGTEVTVVEGAERILALEEPEASAVVARAFAAEGVRVLTGTRAESVRHADGRFTVSVTDASGSAIDLAAERVLVAAGRRPNLADIGLETVALDPGSRSVETDAWMRAGERLWAIGDIAGHGQWTHMSMYQAGIALRDITGSGGEPASYHAVPRVTFTDPEVGAVGMTERQARDAGLDVRVGTSPLGDSTRGWIARADGVVKVVEDRAAGHLVGATAVGPAGGEVVGLLVTAVHARVPTTVLREMILAYPTFHRAVGTALAALGG
ncbi:MAG: dihydrolipoyl dehydrogenase family protein, partial [Dermatophilaceae bacterium]